MKRQISKKSRRVFSMALVMVMVLTGVQFPSMAAEAEVEVQTRAQAGLVNIAPDSLIHVPSSEKPAENLVDGNDETLWVQNGSEWPSTVSFQLPADNTKPIKKVVIKFEKGYPERSVDIKLSHALNNITDQLIQDDVKEAHSFGEVYEFEYETALTYSHTYITLNNPKTNGAEGTFWPGIAEVEIWAEETEEHQDIVNVAGNSVISSVGGDFGEKDNLVDENYDTLYVFHRGGVSTIDGPAWVEISLDKEYPVTSMEAAFELKDPDPDSFEFTFDVLGKSAEDTQWRTLFANVKATRLKDGHIQPMSLAQTEKLKSVRIEIKDIANVNGDPWPALAEFKIFSDVGGSDVADTESIAYGKPVHTNAGQKTVARVNDGSTVNVWSGDRYPAYIDIDLEANYNLDEIEVYTPSEGYSQYSIYTSMDGKDFDKLAEKTSKEKCPAEGESYAAEGKEARIVRVYVEYQSTSSRSLINEIRVLGTPSGTAVQETPEVVVEKFNGSKYDVEITAQDTVKEVQGIIERRLGERYVDWFSFKIEDGKHDYFELSQQGNQIQIKGNDGVSLATGLNHYLKYYCNVHISQVGDQVDMPEAIIPIEGTVHKETKFPVRYSYNYCTLSYSMAFWGEEEWRNELDWLALNGVNVVLDATAQEEVWRRFLNELGYTHEEAKDFIAGPAYYAWAYMANLSGFGGPVHDSWFVERTELARKNQLIMRKLGMQPVLQGYSGMVPVDIKEKDSEAEVIGQGLWCSFQRPSMLKTDSATFDKYAEVFYRVQKEVYGDVSDYYATDPFHEGGNTGGMSSAVIAQKVLASMMKADSEGIWIIQSWQGNPTTALLQGLDAARDHALVLDLYAEKTPHWNETNPGAYGGGEFLDTPWVYCMLNNFGGRLGLHGHIENFVNGVVEASKTAEHMAGIGITPEASVNNPVLYDLFFETIWTDDADNLEVINLDKWFKDYTTRRYGAESESAYEAMLILNETVYNPELNMNGQGAPESVINARPGLDVHAASTWGNAVIDYEKEELERAAALLLEDYDTLKDSAGYQYDLANVLEQVLSNTAQEYQKKMANAFRSGNAEQFAFMAEQFLGIATKVEEVTGTQEEFMVGTWIEAAKALAKNADDFTKELYELNARGLITTWGSIDQANAGQLSDYSNRQWAGLTNDYYKMRWEKWIAERTKELAGEEYVDYNNNDWFEIEWAWARENKLYPTEPNGLNLQKLGEEILEKYSVSVIPKDPAENDEFDLPTEGMTASAGSVETGGGAAQGPAGNVLDGNTSTIWHSKWSGDERENLWIDIALAEKTEIAGIRVLPRSEGGVNGIITEYRIDVSTDGQKYETIATGSWSAGSSWKMARFDEVEATNVRLYAVNSQSDQEKNFASMAEMRIISSESQRPTEPEVDKSSLEEAIKEAKAINKDKYTEESVAVLTTAIEKAEEVAAKKDATQEEVNAAKKAIEDAIAGLEEKPTEPEVDKSGLEEAIKEAKAIKKDKYTEDSVAVLTAAIEKAEELVAKKDATQDEVNAAKKAIEDAIAGLEEKTEPPVGEVNKEALKAAIQEAESKNGADYVEASWKAFEVVLEAARKVKEDKYATQDVVDETVKTLEDAMKALIRKPVEEIFKDVRDGDWYYDEVEWVYNNKIMTGYGDTRLFGPANTLQRAEFAKIMYNYVGAPKVEFKAEFADVREGDWYAPAVIWAYEEGVIKGYDNTNTFGPADEITREQIATILYRFAESIGLSIETDKDLSSFPDANKVSPFAEKAMQWAVGNGIIKGTDEGYLNPGGNANRAEAATMMKRVIPILEKK